MAHKLLLIPLLAAFAAGCGRSELGVLPGGGAAAAGSGTSGNGPSGGGGSGGSGTGAPCRVDAECTDQDPCTSDQCLRGRCDHAERDDDLDGFIAETCGGDDCNDRNAGVAPGIPEVCADGADNDCNGVTDCLDPACEGVGDCGCTPAGDREQCTNGSDDDCDAMVDCLDPDCVGTPACGCTDDEAARCDNGIDDDCDGTIDCSDSDCENTAACQCQAQPETCTNGSDEDCDLLVDCADPDCAGSRSCICVEPGVPEVCQGGSDEDCDGLVDCADPDCVLSPSCANCTVEVCDNGADDDCDGAIDCADTACYRDPVCPAASELCNNDLDDDFDGFADCADADCRGNPWCAETRGNCLLAQLITGSGQWIGSTAGDASDASGTCGGAAGEAIFELVLDAPSRVHIDTRPTQFDSVVYVRAGSCGAGREIGCDDDSGGEWDSSLDFDVLSPGTYFIFVDGLMVDPDLGPDEGSYTLNVEVTPNPTEACTDGMDNDGDRLADCADGDCAQWPVCMDCNGGGPAEPEIGPAACTDGRDNDCDGASDCADGDCSASDVFDTECCTGTDQNGNGIEDDFNCVCLTDADCPASQICYTHTVGTCGPWCEAFVGDVCPLQAPGSTCSPATGQCEF